MKLTKWAVKVRHCNGVVGSPRISICNGHFCPFQDTEQVVERKKLVPSQRPSVVFEQYAAVWEAREGCRGRCVTRITSRPPPASPAAPSRGCICFFLIPQQFVRPTTGVPDLTEEQKQEIREAFALFDMDGTGCVGGCHHRYCTLCCQCDCLRQCDPFDLSRLEAIV